MRKLLLALLIVAVGQAVVAGTAAAAASSRAAIRLSGPSSVLAGARFQLTVSGYFNVSRRHLGHGANVAYVNQFVGDVGCAHPFAGSQLLSGPAANHHLRARNENTPGKFSATLNVTAPQKPGDYTVCGTLLNFPAGGTLRTPRAILHYVVHQ